MIHNITDILDELLPASRINNLLENNDTTEFRKVNGSSGSFLINHIHKFARHILVITPGSEEASAIASDLHEIQGADKLLYFPPTHIKPYNDQMVPDLSVMVQRSEVLDRLKEADSSILCTSSDAIREKLISSEDFKNKSISVSAGENISPEKLRELLTDQGYEAVKFVDQPGEFALRGGIFDVYPYSGEYPVRLEFFGDEVESIREFDSDSQRSVAFLNEARFVPNAAFESENSKQSIFEYLPHDTVVFLHQPDLILEEIKNNFRSAVEIFNDKGQTEMSPPESIFLTPDEYLSTLQDKPLFITGSFHETVPNFTNHVDIDSSPHPEFNGSFKLLRSNIEEKSRDGIETVILFNSQNQRERLEELLDEPSDFFNYRLLLFSLHEGFELKDNKLSILTDHQIFNRYHRPNIHRPRRLKGGISFKELRDLNVGDYVVHVDYGIGKFAGFKKIEVKGAAQEAAVLKYQDNSILYVNVSSLHKLQKYSGKEGTAPRVTKLGSGEWARKKNRTKKKVKDIARDLISLYAKRKKQSAHAYSKDISWQTEMEARFEFEETPDQMTAIQSVKKDMESGQPMDRLICGDVGFGKTEVAVRAAFKAVMDQKQVAVLVPTTILADQHHKTFTERIKDFPLNIEVISRFRTPGEQKKILEDLEKGKVDILIGTHRLVSNDVTFKDLGLLVIDEEQRFGVAVKEKLKKFRVTVDVMTMTATPIPRTLQFSLMGARDLSVINTPPANRQPVYTEIHSFNHGLIRDAISHEKARGGQVFFIHNRIRNIEGVADLIRQLVPEARVRFGHGQMSPSKLEKIIHDFYHNKFDVLVSTNIVENGIDISNANTIFINNANHFGLSELHQLRGRVGRSNRKAYCYLLTPPVQTLTPEARKRLTALEEFSDLGSGFNIAMRDLDIRGAGDILGAEQSGFVNDLGFELYSKILNDAVNEIKTEEFSGMFESEPVNISYPESHIEFDYSALLESQYVSDNVERLNLYRKLAEAGNETEFEEWEEELRDRFGPLPGTAKNLLLAARIKFYASRLLLMKVTIRSNRMWLLCPKNDSETGKEYFESGLFQKQLNTIQKISGENYQLLQKKDIVRIVIQNIPDPVAAIDYLNTLYKETVSPEGVPA